MIGDAGDDITIAELAFEGWQSLSIFCGKCRRQQYVEFHKLPGDPRETTMGDLRRRLVCRQCINPPAPEVKPWQPDPAAPGAGPREITREPLPE